MTRDRLPTHLRPKHCVASRFCPTGALSALSWRAPPRNSPPLAHPIHPISLPYVVWWHRCRQGQGKGASDAQLWPRPARGKQPGLAAGVVAPLCACEGAGRGPSALPLGHRCTCLRAQRTAALCCVRRLQPRARGGLGRVSASKRAACCLSGVSRARRGAYVHTEVVVWWCQGGGGGGGPNGSGVLPWCPNTARRVLARSPRSSSLTWCGRGCRRSSSSWWAPMMTSWRRWSWASSRGPTPTPG